MEEVTKREKPLKYASTLLLVNSCQNPGSFEPTLRCLNFRAVPCE